MRHGGDALLQTTAGEWNRQAWVVLELGAGTDDEIHVLRCDGAIGHAEDPRSGLHDDDGAGAGFHDDVESTGVAAAQAWPQRQNLNERPAAIERKRPHNLERRLDARARQRRAAPIRLEYELDPPVQPRRRGGFGSDHAASNRTCRRIHSMTSFRPSPRFRFVKMTGLPARTEAASRSM